MAAPPPPPLLGAGEQAFVNRLVALYHQARPCVLSPAERAVLHAAIARSQFLERRNEALESGFVALPMVTKQVRTGPRGGALYVNALGHRVWLKQYQRRQCTNGSLRGAGGTCPTPFREYAPRADAGQPRHP